jgi:hypothetical protein
MTTADSCTNLLHVCQTRYLFSTCTQTLLRKFTRLNIVSLFSSDLTKPASCLPEFAKPNITLSKPNIGETGRELLGDIEDDLL